MSTKQPNYAVERPWNKLAKLIEKEGVGAVPKRMMRWIYWNGRLYLARRVPGVDQLRTFYKYHKWNKKYGISDPIVIYQMGKVGSSSVFKSLKALDLDVPVYHTHFLNDLDKYESLVRRTFVGNSNAIAEANLGREIRRQLERAPNKKWNMISLVRAPIPREISAFFENSFHLSRNSNDPVPGNQLTANELVKRFLDYSKDFTDSGWTLGWFDSQIKEVLGIDVYSTEFDKSRGFQMYEKDNIRLIVIRMEDLTRCISDAMALYLGISDFVLLNENMARQRPYAALYREFLDGLKLTPAYVQERHDSKFASHFYTPEELADSVQRFIC